MCLQRKYILFIKENKPNLVTFLEYIILASSLKRFNFFPKFYDSRSTLSVASSFEILFFKVMSKKMKVIS